MPGRLFSDLLQHDRVLVLGGLAVVITAAWVYLVLGAGIEMATMNMGGGGRMIMPPEWTAAYTLLILAMWVVMMAAMMLPSAAPTVLLVEALARRQAGGLRAGPGAALLFASGYLIVWGGFSLIATLLQSQLDRWGLLSDKMAVANATIAAVVLIAAGVYQWTPLKQACLRHCRSPAEFLVGHWRRGALGAVVTGTQHGVYCLGCCWMLMALLFAAGLMNLSWVAAIAVFVLLEKAIPWGDWIGRIVGALLAVGGAVALIRTF